MFSNFLSTAGIKSWVSLIKDSRVQGFPDCIAVSHPALLTLFIEVVGTFKKILSCHLSGFGVVIPFAMSQVDFIDKVLVVMSGGMIHPSE